MIFCFIFQPMVALARLMLNVVMFYSMQGAPLENVAAHLDFTMSTTLKGVKQVRP